MAKGLAPWGGHVAGRGCVAGTRPNCEERTKVPESGKRQRGFSGMLEMSQARMPRCAVSS
jgi:hypothetical protein